MNEAESAVPHPDRGRQEHEQRQLLDLLSVAVVGSDADESRPDVGRLLGLLSELDAGAEDLAADWVRDALHDRD